MTDLVKLLILQSGTLRSPISFLSVVPNEVFFPIVQQTLINFKSNDEVIQDLNISTKFAEQIFAAVQSQMSASQVNDLVAHAESNVKNGFLAIPPPPVNTEVNLNLSNYAENSAKAKKHKKSYEKRNKEFITRVRKRLKCLKCSLDKWYLIEFHHLDPKTKEIGVTNLQYNAYSIERIKKEKIGRAHV